MIYISNKKKIDPYNSKLSITKIISISRNRTKKKKSKHNRRTKKTEKLAQKQYSV